MDWIIPLRLSTLLIAVFPCAAHMSFDSVSYAGVIFCNLTFCMYNNIQVVFDSLKNFRNIAKHDGVSLTRAAEFDWDTALTWQDQRHDYKELRMRGIGYIGTRLFHIVYVDRDEQRRIISLRKANQREEKRYAKA